MDLPRQAKFYQLLLYVLENCVSVLEPVVKGKSSWFDILTPQMFIFTFFISTGVLFERVFPCELFLNNLHKEKNVYNEMVVSYDPPDCVKNMPWNR